MKKTVVKLPITMVMLFCFFNLFSQETKSIDFFVKLIREQKVDNNLKIDTFSFYENKLVGVRLLNDIGNKYSLTIYERIQDIKYDYYKPTDIFTVYYDSMYFKFKGFLQNEERSGINVKSITVFDSFQAPMISFVFLADKCKFISKYSSNHNIIDEQTYIPIQEMSISTFNLNNLPSFREQLFKTTSKKSMKKEEFLVLLSNDLLW